MFIMGLSDIYIERHRDGRVTLCYIRDYTRSTVTKVQWFIIIGLLVLFADIENVLGPIRVFRDWASHALYIDLTGPTKGRVVIDDGNTEYYWVEGEEEYKHFG